MNGEKSWRCSGEKKNEVIKERRQIRGKIDRGEETDERKE